jgi:hypothetical protein
MPVPARLRDDLIAESTKQKIQNYVLKQTKRQYAFLKGRSTVDMIKDLNNYINIT